RNVVADDANAALHAGGAPGEQGRIADRELGVEVAVPRRGRVRVVFARAAGVAVERLDLADAVARGVLQVELELHLVRDGRAHVVRSDATGAGIAATVVGFSDLDERARVDEEPLRKAELGEALVELIGERAQRRGVAGVAVVGPAGRRKHVL